MIVAVAEKAFQTHRLPVDYNFAGDGGMQLGIVPGMHAKLVPVHASGVSSAGESVPCGKNAPWKGQFRIIGSEYGFFNALGEPAERGELVFRQIHVGMAESAGSFDGVPEGGSGKNGLPEDLGAREDPCQPGLTNADTLIGFEELAIFADRHGSGYFPHSGVMIETPESGFGARRQVVGDAWEIEREPERAEIGRAVCLNGDH